MCFPSLLNQRLFPAEHTYKEVAHLDIHTAIGPYGESMVFVTDEKSEQLAKQVPGASVLWVEGSTRLSIMLANLRKSLPHVGNISWRAVLEEYGTYADVPVLLA